jgi:hypothetical protein
MVCGMVSCVMRRADFIHLCLMLIAFGLAYVVPLELLVLAYVVLGPAHYTTEISWLHGRRYFVPHRGYAVALAVIALGAALVTNASWFGFVMWAALVLGALFITPRNGAQGVVLAIAATGLTAIFYSRSPALAVIGVLLPTLIHVSVFTLIFMALGAWRARSAPQSGLIAVYLAAIALILFVPPTGATVIPRFAAIAQDYFGTVAQALGVLFGTRDIHLDMRLTGLLSFLYTYHYLNWFIKAEVIRWADIPRGECGVDRTLFLRLRARVQRASGAEPRPCRAGVPAQCAGNPSARRGGRQRLDDADSAPARKRIIGFRASA